MAKAPAKPEAAEAAPKKGKKGLLIIIAAVVVLAGGGGAAFMMMGKKGGDDHAEAKAAPKVDRSKPAAYVTLEPFTTNLAREDGDRFVQLIAVVKITDAKFEPELKLRMPELRHRINLLLVGKKPSELGTMEGREILSEEILVEANDVLGFPPAPPSGRKGAPAAATGPVEAILFNSLIIQ